MTTSTRFNPFKLHVNGQVYENNNGEAARDRLFRALAERHEAKTALMLARDDDDEGPASAPQEDISKAGKFLKDVGVDVDKMQERAEKEREKLEARAERAENARLTAETADRSMGLNPLALDFARDAIRDRMAPREEDPVTLAVKQAYAKQIAQNLSGERPSAVQEMTQMAEGWKAMMAVAQTLAPPVPAAVAVGMSPEKAFELEMKRLELHMELEKYKADKEAEAAGKRANAFKEVAEVIKTAAETVGYSVGEAMGAQFAGGGAQAATTRQRPAAPRQRPAAPRESTVECTTQAATCPDCNQDAIMVTASMQQRVAAGGLVEATCTNCGTAHILEVDQPVQREEVRPRPVSREPASPAPQPVPTARRQIATPQLMYAS